MYLFCNSRIHVITLYSGQVYVYYVSMLRCWHLIWILVRTDHPCLGVGCHITYVAYGFPVSRMFEVEGKDGIILTLGDRWCCNPNLGTTEGFCKMV
jgi:hypothetical protein